MLPVDVVEQYGVPRSHPIVDRGCWRRSRDRVAMRDRLYAHLATNRTKGFTGGNRRLLVPHESPTCLPTDRTHRLVADKAVPPDACELYRHGVTEKNVPSRE